MSLTTDNVTVKIAHPRCRERCVTLPHTVHLGTDVAGFAIYHPDDFQHRWDSEMARYYDDFAAESVKGRIVGWTTGSDGSWSIKLTDRPGELPLVEGRSAEFLLVVRRDRVLIDDTSCLPSTEFEPAERPDTDDTRIPTGR